MPIPMTNQEAVLFSQLIVDLAGIRIEPTKKYMLETRLDDVLHLYKMKSYAELYEKARFSRDKAIISSIVDALSTNETFFFRDPKTFDLIKHKIVPDLLGANIIKPLRIWSAAASTGQEAYTLAISLKEILFDLSAVHTTILGTDISPAAVDAANRAIYSMLEIRRGLEARHLERYFHKFGEGYKLNDELRSICRFEVDNLLNPVAKGPFDIILCRNVLIYFSADDKKKVVNNLLTRLKPTGYLIVAATESLLEVTPRVKRHEFHGATYYTPI